jgi:cytoskeleton protein RodZ
VTSLGDQLRQAREARGLSIQAVSGTTKIREHILIALETDSFDELPAPVFVRGFLRTLARYLRLNPEELLGLYAAAVPQEVAPAAPPVAEVTPVELPAITTGPALPRWLSPSSLLVGLLAVVIVAAIVWGGSQLLQGVSLPDLAALVPTNTAVAPTRVAATPLPAAGASTAPTAAATIAPSQAPTFAFPTPTVPPVASFEVRLDILTRSWVKVEVDGASVQEGVLDAGVIKTYKPASRLTLRVGNAAGVSVTLNGHVLPPLGAEGDVVDRQWVMSSDGAIALATPTWTKPPATATAPAGPTPAATEAPPAAPVPSSPTVAPTLAPGSASASPVPSPAR